MFFERAQAGAGEADVIRARPSGHGRSPCSSGAPKLVGEAHVLRARPNGWARPMLFGRAQA
eukprot:7353707-Alexandrium_andersonii.AAC.1